MSYSIELLRALFQPTANHISAVDSLALVHLIAFYPFEFDLFLQVNSLNYSALLKKFYYLFLAQ
jgi:hypothetical protein